ncbi:MAG: benzoate/H(+) symporter BenE family transporter, partial [Rhodospirillaceae bacterium]|nr:benzoate/H(+) symporter BenE family transporter [Rhodospirillaceae bacterium]
MFERPAPDRPRFAETLLAVRPHHLANAVVAFLFASTGPVALILTIGIAGGLSTETLSSWIFIGFAGGGAITFAMSWFYKQPLAFAWTISGTAIAGQALLKYPFAEIVGAYMVTGAVMILLGVTSGFKAIMRFVPQPIVMAMVAGVFLKFGILAVDAFDKELRIALAALVAWVVFSFWKPVARFLPPVLMALLAAGYMPV